MSIWSEDAWAEPWAEPAAPALPLTASQKGLWVTHRLGPRQLHNIVVTIGLDPAIGTPRIAEALAAVLAVQPALRMRVADPLTGTALIEEPLAAADLPFEDIGHCGAAEAHAVVARLGAHRFDLARGPLLRFAHARPDGRSVLVMAVHHLVFDGFSLQPFADDLAGFLTAPGPAAPGDRLRAAREARLLGEHAAQAAAEGSAATGRRAAELAGSVAGTAPASLGGATAPAADGGDRAARRLRWEPDPAARAAIRSAHRALGLTGYEFFTAVYATALHAHTGDPAVVLGSPFLARHTFGALGLCGFFVNTLPLALRPGAAPSFARFATEQVAPAVTFVRDRAKVPLPHLLSLLRPERAAHRTPLFNCVLAVQDTPVCAPPVRSVRVHGNGTAEYDVWLGVTDTPGGGLALELEHATAAVPVPEADALWAAFRSVLRTALDRPAAARTPAPG
ncbi:condensation domain-containing protein [Streptomyces sp. PsTaAH-124]|uniref:condensation domain-containing protein n=1 Tax=Streptomyces sp. PsTaAH-124 TaxID=1157638 RepID=UPI00035C7DC1|nr:condensation domain-containing protein [Streptomyces sp. PsTaAH-124]